MDRPALSVVVPTRDRGHLLEECLASLQRDLAATDELIVVDSASVHATSQPIASSYHARFLRCDVPGASIARNAGWRAATNDLVAFVDDDIRVEPGWADALARAFSGHPDAAFVTGRIGLPPNAPPPRQALAQKTDEHPAWLTGAADEVLGHSANLAVRRAALAAVDGFDERLGAGGEFRAAEDLDLFERLLASGHRGRYEPGASAYHESWRDTRELVKVQYAYGVGLGARLIKLARTDRARSRAVVRATLIDDGWRPLWAAVRRRSRFETATRAARLGGVVVGVVRALPRKVQRGHFAASRRQRQAGRSGSAPR